MVERAWFTRMSRAAVVPNANGGHYSIHRPPTHLRLDITINTKGFQVQT